MSDEAVCVACGDVVRSEEDVLHHAHGHDNVVINATLYSLGPGFSGTFTLAPDEPRAAPSEAASKP